MHIAYRFAPARVVYVTINTSIHATGFVLYRSVHFHSLGPLTTGKE